MRRETWDDPEKFIEKKKKGPNRLWSQKTLWSFCRRCLLSKGLVANWKRCYTPPLCLSVLIKDVLQQRRRRQRRIADSRVMPCFVYAGAAFTVAPSLLSFQKGQIFAGEETRKRRCDLRSVRELQLKVPECRSILWHQEKGSGLGFRTRFCCCISSTTAVQSSTTWRGEKIQRARPVNGCSLKVTTRVFGIRNISDWRLQTFRQPLFTHLQPEDFLFNHLKSINNQFLFTANTWPPGGCNQFINRAEPDFALPCGEQIPKAAAPYLNLGDSLRALAAAISTVLFSPNSVLKCAPKSCLEH